MFVVREDLSEVQRVIILIGEDLGEDFLVKEFLLGRLGSSSGLFCIILAFSSSLLLGVSFDLLIGGLCLLILSLFLVFVSILLLLISFLLLIIGLSLLLSSIFFLFSGILHFFISSLGCLWILGLVGLSLSISDLLVSSSLLRFSSSGFGLGIISFLFGAILLGFSCLLLAISLSLFFLGGIFLSLCLCLFASLSLGNILDSRVVIQ